LVEVVGVAEGLKGVGEVVDRGVDAGDHPDCGANVEPSGAVLG